MIVILASTKNVHVRQWSRLRRKQIFVKISAARVNSSPFRRGRGTRECRRIWKCTAPDRSRSTLPGHTSLSATYNGRWMLNAIAFRCPGSTFFIYSAENGPSKGLALRPSYRAPMYIYAAARIAHHVIHGWQIRRRLSWFTTSKMFLLLARYLELDT